MKHKSAFSLIELLVVLAIIGIMAVITIPFFSRYGSRSEFNLRTIEVKSLIEQMNNMAKNPEQGITRYLIKVDTANGNVGLYKKDDTAGNLIKEIDPPAGYSARIQTIGKYLICDSPGDVCCYGSSIPAGSCPASSVVVPTGDDWMILDGGNGGDDGSAPFNIKSAPFRVSY